MTQSLTQLGKQLLAIWKQLGLNQKISLVLAAGAVLAGLAVIGVWSSHGEYSLLYGKLDEAEAAKVISYLDESKTPYRISHGGSAILIPSSKVYPIRMQLASKGVPKGEGVGFEIFDKPNFAISDFIQRANYTRAIQGELSRTISQLDQVEAARVMIVLPENRLLIDNQKKPTASVFIRVRGNGTLSPSGVNSIRFLVANSVEGLQANNVTVVDNQGNVLSENQENDSIAGLSNNQLAARKSLEQYLSKKVEGMLEKVLGPGQAVIRVSAEINWDSATKTEERYDPDGQTIRSSQITDENSETSNGNVGGVPGVSVNGNADNTNNVAQATSNNGNKTRKKQTNNQYEINRTSSNILQSAGGIKRLSAAVFVAPPVEIDAKGKRTVKPRSDADLKKLQHIVQNALGIQAAGDAVPEITLEEMAFNDEPARRLTEQLDTQQKREFWSETGQKLLYPALAVGIMALFWRSFRKTRSEEIPIGVPLNYFNGNGHANGHTNGNGNHRDVVTVDVLNQLIRENPTGMTQAVKNWMNRGQR